MKETTLVLAMLLLIAGCSSQSPPKSNIDIECTFNGLPDYVMYNLDCEMNANMTGYYQYRATYKGDYLECCWSSIVSNATNLYEKSECKIIKRTLYRECHEVNRS
jgi:hypothetical protein